MSNDRHTRFREEYRRQVRELRLTIDSLPEDLRPHLRKLVDENEQACLRLQDEAQHTCGIADDLSLATTRCLFHIEATWREMQENPRGSTSLPTRPVGLR